jgi:glutamate-ammonia-ligase adenylyltransferase
VNDDARLGTLLVRLGFLEPDVARDDLASSRLGWWDRERQESSDSGAAAAIAALGRTPDPDAALHHLVRIVEAADPEEAAAIAGALRDSGGLRSRLLNLLGASEALADHLASFPTHWRVLLDDDPLDPATRIKSAIRTDPVADLRAAYRRELVGVAGRDFSGELDLPTVTERLTDLADAVLVAALDHASRLRPPEAEPFRLAIIAMGKTGARELNYISDVDVIFVFDPPPRADEERSLASATAVAVEVMRICGAAAWEVDAALRPEGRDGPLVRSLASHEAYYRRWASAWEFQALLKARPVAGDDELGRRYMDVVSPMVWVAAQRPDFVTNVQAMRRRVVAQLPSTTALREIKLGPGGLRDVEFAVQLLQLVHGRADPALRERGTFAALAALRDGGYVGRDDALSLADAYGFLRAVEHRVQLRKLRRTHLIPEDPSELSVLARAMGFRPDSRGGAVAVFEAEWTLHVREVRRLHEKLFYRPLLEAVARVPAEHLRLTPEQAGERLAALGFADPAKALRHLEALTSGVSRRALLQQALLPLMLSYFADAPDPDAGLLAYRQVSDALGSTPWYLRLLRDEGQVAARLAYVLATSRYVVDMLLRAPEALQLLGDDAELQPRTVGELRTEMVSIVQRKDDDTEAVAIARGTRREELLRIAFADLLGRLDVVEVGEAISATTDATLDAALQAASASVEREHGTLPVRIAVIAVGRLGGGEAGYGSDADVLFVYEPIGARGEDDGRIAQRVAERMRTLLSATSSDPPLGIDADLRPEGRNGPLARSLDSYARYYARWSEPWEAQALLRARVCVGDEELAARFIELIDPVRYPAGGLSPEQLTEIRRIKARVESERLPRGADPATHTKLGRGGLADVEWTVQLLQLAHGFEIEQLRTPRTLEALAAAHAAGLISTGDRSALEAAWRMSTHSRNAIMLVRDKADDQLPKSGKELVGVGRAMGYPAGFDPGQLVDDYRRSARHARRVVESVFYGATR